MTHAAAWKWILGLVLVALASAAISPSALPTTWPTSQPSRQPTGQPTSHPSSQPSGQPVVDPTSFPTSMPTQQPSLYSPHLLATSFDLSVGNLTLYFDHLMSIKTLNVSSILMQSAADGSNSSTATLRLTGSYNKLERQGNRTSAVVMMTADDYAQLRFNEQIALSADSLFVSLNYDAIRSAFNASVEEVPLSSGVHCIAYKNDTLSPFLSSYRLNMNIGTLELTFSEPIDIATFSIEGLALQRSKNAKVTSVDESQYYEFVANDDWAITRVSNFNRTVELSMGFLNTNAIKRAIGLAVTRETTFLSAWKSFVKDLAGNALSLVAVDRLHGMPPAEYLGDYSAPYLRYWDYDASRGTFALFFSETVYLQFFNFSGVVLSNGTQSLLRVHNPVNISHHDFDIIRFSLNDVQRQQLQSIPHLFTLPNNSYIVLEQGLVVDTASTQNPYSSSAATELNPMPVREFQYDVFRPELMSWSLDLELGLLEMSFSKTIRLSSLQLTNLYLQSAENQVVGTEMYQLSSNDVDVLTDSNLPTIRLSLKSQLLHKLRNFAFLGKAREFTYLSAWRSLLTDTSAHENPLIDVTTAHALQVSELVTDSSHPVLMEWSIDMVSNVITFNFSKTVEVQSTRLHDATLSSDLVALTISQSIRLTDSVLLTQSLYSSVVQVRLSARDEWLIKSSPGFCQSNTTCYLTITTTFARSVANISETDPAQKTYLFVQAARLLPCQTFVADSIPPVLSSFTADWSALRLTLQFSKPIFAESVDLTQMFLSFSGDLSVFTNNTMELAHRESVPLNQFCIAGDTLVNNTLIITLNDHVYRQFGRLSPLGIRTSSTYLYLGHSAVQDVAGNFAISTMTRAHAIVADTSPPKVIGIYLDPSLMNVTVYFNEAVNLSSLSLSQTYFTSTVTVQALSLSGASIEAIPSANASTVVIDLTNIRASLTSSLVATSQSTTSLYLSSSSGVMRLRDASPQHNRASSQIAAQAVKDGVILTSFQLDLNSGRVLIGMNFFKNLTILSPSGLTIRTVDLTASHSLTSFTVERIVDGPGLILTLGDFDRLQISSKLPLDSKSKLVLVVVASAVQDENQKFLAQSASLPCQLLISDRVVPVVSSYSMSLSDGLLVLQFNKLVDVMSLDLTANGFVFYGYPHSTNVSFALASSIRPIITSGSSLVSKQLMLSLEYGSPLTERERLLLQYPIGLDVSTTLLTLRRGVVNDIAHPANPSEAITFVSALRPTSLSYDVVSPVLLGFDLQLTSRVLTLNFSEAINVRSIYLPAFTLASSRDQSAATYYALTSSSKPLDYTPSRTVRVLLSSIDVDAMMYTAPNLLLTASTTFLSVTSSGFRDLAFNDSGNWNEPVYFRYALAVTSYTRDEKPPQLLQYNISLMDGILELLFDEIVDCNSLNTEKIYFQPWRFLGRRPLTRANFVGSSITSEATDNFEDFIVRLSQESYCEVENRQNFDTKLRVVVGYNDLERIRATYRTLKSANTTYLRLDAGAVNDAFGNGIVAIDDNNALPVTVFVSDTVRPTLLAFSISNTHMLKLFFDKAVDYRRLDLSKIFFQDQKQVSSPSLLVGYNLSDARLYATDSSKKVLDISLLSDFQRIKTSSHLFRSQYQSNIHVLLSTVYDLNGNAMNPVPASYAITVGPRVINWDLELNSGYILLEFSEAVDPNFTLLGFSVHAEKNLSQSEITSNNSYSFVAEDLATSTKVGDRVYRFYLSSYDWQQLKLSGLIVAPASNALVREQSALYRHYPLFLSVTRNVTLSIAPDSFMPQLQTLAIRPSEALPLRYFIPDTSPPVCQYYDLNLDSGVLLVWFTEPVGLDSLVASSFTLFSIDSGIYVTLSSSMMHTVPSGTDSSTINLASIVNQTALQIELSLADLNNIKLATWNDNNAVQLDGLILSTGAVSDMSGNAILGNSADHPISLRLYVNDQSPPVVQQVEFDAKAFAITILFDEAVDASLFHPWDALLLHDLSNISFPNATTSLSFTNLTLVNQSDTTSSYANALGRRTIMLDAGFLRDDMLMVEQHPVLFLNLSKTFLVINHMKDWFGNEMALNAVQPITSFVANTQDVTLEGFDLTTSSTAGKHSLILYFSRTMSLANFTCSDFALSASISSSESDVVALTSSTCSVISTVNDRIVELEVTSTVFSSSSIGSTASSTFIYTGSSTLQSIDVYGNKLRSLVITSALEVGPRVLRSSLDMNTGMLLLIFSKEVTVSSFTNLTAIGLYSTVSRKVFHFSTSSVVGYRSQALVGYSSLQDDFISVVMSAEDLSALKLIDVRKGSAFLVLAAGACVDSNSFSCNEKTLSSLFLVDRVTADSLSPRIINITLDMSSEKLVLEFDEPLLLSTFNPTNIRLQSSAAVPVANGSFVIHNSTAFASNASATALESFRLTGGVVSQSGNIITVVFNDADANLIKLSPAIAKSINSSFISLDYRTATDVAGNVLESISVLSARQVDLYIRDSRQPELVEYTLDMNRIDSAIMTLKFTEPVDMSSFNATDLVVQSRYFRRDGVFYKLTGGTLLSANSDTVILKLLSSDVLNIKLTDGLMRKKQSSFIVFSSFWVTDVSGNSVVPHLDGNAFVSTAYVANAIPPWVLHSLLDMQNRQLTLTINEPVILSTVDVTQISLLSALVSTDNSESMLSHQLSNASTAVQSSILSATIVINFSLHDFDAVSALSSSRHTSWLHISQRCFQNFASVFNDDEYALQISEYQEDLTRPSVTSYSLDMNFGNISLSFSESIDPGSVQLSEIYLQSVEVRRFGKSLKLSNTTADVVSNKMVLRLDDNSMLQIKYFEIGANAFSSFLSYSDIFVLDFTGNRVMPAWDGSVVGYSPLSPSAFIPDILPPKVTRWYVNRATISNANLLQSDNAAIAEIVFYFDEPIVVHALNRLYVSSSRHSDPWVPLVPSALVNSTVLVYKHFNTELRVFAKNYCLDTMLPINKTCSSSLFAYLLQMKSDSSANYGLLVGPSAVLDFALTRNSIDAINEKYLMLAEGQPDCSACSEGTFVSQNCTWNSDRVCSQCQMCHPLQFELLSCEPYRDRSCADCKSCRTGYYASQLCSPTKNTICDLCTECGFMTYAERPCSLGSNAVCNSCEQCSFDSPAAEKICESFGAYRTWKRENCCRSPLNEYTLCKHKSNRH